MGDLISRHRTEMAVLSNMWVPPNSKFSNGSMPNYFWVASGGSDGVGNGAFDNPYLTLRRAIRESVDGRGDVVNAGPGSYTETIDIGSGGTSSGSNGGYAKRNLKIIATGGTHPGITQIIGDGSTAQPTIRVLSGYLRGFVLKGFELDTNTLSQPCLELVTSDTAALTATSGDYHALIEDVHIVSDGTPTTGIILTAATKVRFKNITVAGCVVGMAWRGSPNNFTDDVKVWDAVFHDNVTADIASYSGDQTIGVSNATNIQFFRPQFMDRGGTPVTNYANISGTTVNCGFYEFDAARDVADGTLMQLPVDWIAIGNSAAAAEFIIGA